MLYISYITPIVSSPQPLSTPLKAIARGFFVLFHIGIWSPSTIHPHLNLFHSPSSFLLVPTLTYCTYFTVLSFLINISVDVQRGFLMYPCCEIILLWSVQPLPLLFLTPLPLTPHFLTPFIIHPYILYLHRCYALQYYWCSIILFSFLSVPKFHSLAPLLQTCSIYEFVYECACFYVYVYLLDLSSMYEKKHAAFVFLFLAYFT
jgi:hypothetical protein